MFSRLVLLLPLALAIGPPLAAQEPGEVLVRPGARVLTQAPVFGPGWLPGQFARARVRGRDCLGVALDARASGGAPMVVLLKGITALRVDRRTNTEVRVLADLGPAADSDWASIDLVALGTQDRGCTGTPTPDPH
jgi:hypothetical protein